MILKQLVNGLKDKARLVRKVSFYWKHCPENAGGLSVVVFPYTEATLHCGLAGLISVYQHDAVSPLKDLSDLWEPIDKIRHHPLSSCSSDATAVEKHCLGGDDVLEQLFHMTGRLKRQDHFVRLASEPEFQKQLEAIRDELDQLIQSETEVLQNKMGHWKTKAVETADRRMEILKDVVWAIQTEILDNIRKVRDLSGMEAWDAPWDVIKMYRNINTVLNSIDRLEVRGRDSAGISLLFFLDTDAYADFKHTLDQNGLTDTFIRRTEYTVLGNKSITEPQAPQGDLRGLTLTYKVAAEIGRLGDNVSQLRRDITHDPILKALANVPHSYHTVSAHTRWASVGAITIANCHPADNGIFGSQAYCKGIIHACLNGDIDNYIALKEQWEASGEKIAEEITTDTKIIPLQVEKYFRQGHSVAEAFRLAVNDFEGSHAIAMHTDLAPGKFFLAQRGSGQAVFVGLAKDHYIPSSEVYGFVEETQSFIKMDGEKIITGKDGPTQGQIFVLDQNSAGGLSGICAVYYDGTPIQFTENDIQNTEITSRDIDRQNYPHYFLKEISEAPISIDKTLQNRWKIDEASGHYTIVMDDATFPEDLVRKFKENQIRRIFFIGQGTAGIAAAANADILNYYLNEPSLLVSALKASELSGFQLDEHESKNSRSMKDTLVVAISQSGTTTDTNRTVDMVRARGAYTMAIVNRRDSDITFKADGVVYTSSGRDIEMSVASTKAFYAQIVAGALVGLKIAEIRNRRSPEFVTEELKSLLQLPKQMRSVLEQKVKIKTSAQRLAPAKTYWAAVGSGPNKAAADEIRIKLSELCYKTISSDYVEDKKHIDLSSEPLIIVCAAGTTATVIGDIIKDTAIFKAHKATPVVIVDEGDDRFDAYAEDVFQVPAVASHLAPILNTLAGHLWGYYAALAINNGSGFLHNFRVQIQNTIDQFAADGLDVYEVVLEKRFREQIAEFYTQFRQKQKSGELPTVIHHAADLLLLLKYLSGRLPVSDFELDFGMKGTALNMLNSLIQYLGESINGMSRPVDAIKHQAKTVTVGTSRISEKTEGILFDALAANGINNAQLINRNILVLKNLQAVVGDIKGSIFYRLDGLNVLGEPTKETTIQVLNKEGVLKPLASRVESDNALKGTKRIIARQGNVYIGKGRKDNRSIIVIPAMSGDASAVSHIKHLLLLNIGFKKKIDLPVKIKALGGKYEHIKNIVQENSIQWEDSHLELMPVEELFGRSAEKIGERIVAQLK
jgi:glucosamine--fructose-6-phosphate aminotransferase (isomerizing)